MRAAHQSAPWLAAALVVSGGVLAWPFTVDDTFIVARYAEHLAHGAGYAFNVGTRSDGITGPLWLLPMLVGEWLSLSPVMVAKLVDLVCAALAAALVVRRAPLPRWGTALLVGTNAAYLPWAVGGLGGGLAALILVCVSRPLCVDHGRLRSVGAGLAVGLLAWLRPEACAAGLVLLLAHGPSREGGARRPWAFVSAALVIAGVILFRVLLFGHVLPLALAAKPGSVLAGLSYVGRGCLVVFGGVGVGALPYALLRGTQEQKIRALALVVHLVAVVAVGGDWMPGYRMLAPIVPLYALTLSETLPGIFTSRPWMRRCVAVVVLALPLGFFALALPSMRASGLAREVRGGALADELREISDTVALVDVGYLAYRSGVPVLDLGGVTDAVVAASVGGHLDKQLDVAYLAHVAPAAILLHAVSAPEVDEEGNLRRLAGYPVERRVAAMPFVRRGYRVVQVIPYAPGYVYVLLVRRDSTRLEDVTN